MLDIFALAFGLLAIAAFMHGSVKRGRIPASRWPASPSVSRSPANGAACSHWAVCIVIVAVIRLMQAGARSSPTAKPATGTGPALARFPLLSLRHLLRAHSATVYLATFVRSTACRLPICSKPSAGFQRQHHDRDRGHTYMSAWPSWPFLVRPVWYLFDKIAEDRIAAVVFLGNPVVLWAALPALAIVLRDWIVTRRADAFLILSFMSGLTWPGRCCRGRSASCIIICRPLPWRASRWSTCCGGQQPALAVMGFVAGAGAGFAAMLPISAAFVGTSMETFVRLMLFQSWI